MTKVSQAVVMDLFKTTDSIVAVAEHEFEKFTFLDEARAEGLVTETEVENRNTSEFTLTAKGKRIWEAKRWRQELRRELAKTIKTDGSMIARPTGATWSGPILNLDVDPARVFIGHPKFPGQGYWYRLEDVEIQVQIESEAQDAD